MGVPPYFFQGTHRGICCGNSPNDVIVVAQVVGDEQAQVSNSLIQMVIHFMLMFCLPGLCSSSLSEELTLHCPMGWYAASDFGRMRTTAEECSLGMNMTYFLVFQHTDPSLPACVGWDEATDDVVANREVSGAVQTWCRFFHYLRCVIAGVCTTKGL